MVKEKGLVVIEISSREIRFLSSSRTLWNKKIELDFCVFPFQYKGHQVESEKLVEILTDFRQSNFGDKKVSAYLPIPLQMGLIRDFKLPWIPQKKRDEAIGYYLEHEIPVPSEELVYYYQELEEKENEFLKVRVSAARREIISKYGKDLTQAGYKLEGVEYAVNSVGGITSLLGDKTIIILQEIKEARLQLALYKGAMLEIVREIDLGQRDISNYLLSLGLQDAQPIDLILSDGSVEAKSFVSLLLTRGLIKDHQITPSSDLSQVDIVNLHGTQIFATYGFLMKLEKAEQANLYSSFLLPMKIRAVALMGGLVFAFLVLFASLIYFPLNSDYISTQTSISDLQMKLANIEIKRGQDILIDWSKLEEKSYSDIEQLHTALTHLDEEITLVRLNYRQGTLYLWAECHDNTSITKLTGRLMADNWKDPVLTNYKYHQQTISFGLSVKR